MTVVEHPAHPKLEVACDALAALVVRSIHVDRHLEYESDDQGGRHAIHGQSITIDLGEGRRESIVVWERTRDLSWFPDKDRQAFADLLGVSPSDLDLPEHGPAFCAALDRLRISSMVCCRYEPLAIAPSGAKA